MALKPICFMVMPFGKKPTNNNDPKAPGEINFDALWDRALRPMIEELGYEPIRADQDVGSLIVQEMIERLAYSDLVIAEMTISERQRLLRSRRSASGATRGLRVDCGQLGATGI